MPLSSQDLLPESELIAIATPAVAFKPVELASPAPAPLVGAGAEGAPSTEPKSTPGMLGMSARQWNVSSRGTVRLSAPSSLMTVISS